MTETVQVALITAVSTLSAGVLGSVIAALLARRTALEERRESRRADAREVLSEMIALGRAWRRDQYAITTVMASKAKPNDVRAAWGTFAESDSGDAMEEKRARFSALYSRASILIQNDEIQTQLQQLGEWMTRPAPLSIVLDAAKSGQWNGPVARELVLASLAEFVQMLDGVERAALRAAGVRI